MGSTELRSPEKLKRIVADIFTTKKEELAYVFEKEELIRLCREKPCKVRMDRWNAVYEFYLQLKRRGRLENKSSQKVQKLLIKLGNRYKNDPRRSFPDRIIKEERLHAWKMRKCWNVRWLNDIRNNFNGSEMESFESDQSVMEVAVPLPSNRNQQQTTTNGPPSYMKNFNFNSSEIVGRKLNILDSESFEVADDIEVETSSREKIKSLGLLFNDVREIVGTESFGTQLIPSEPTILSGGSSNNYESFHCSVGITSTQSQEKQ